MSRFEFWKWATARYERSYKIFRHEIWYFDLNWEDRQRDILTCAVLL